MEFVDKFGAKFIDPIKRINSVLEKGVFSRRILVENVPDYYSG